MEKKCGDLLRKGERKKFLNSGHLQEGKTMIEKSKDNLSLGSHYRCTYIERERMNKFMVMYNKHLVL